MYCNYLLPGLWLFLSFLNKLFSCMTKQSGLTFKYLKFLRWNKKIFFIAYKGLSFKQIKPTFWKVRGPALMTEWFELWTTKFGVSVQNWSVPLWSNQHFMLPRLIKGGTGSPENLQVKNNNGSFLTQTIFTCSKLTKQTIEQGVNFEHI